MKLIYILPVLLSVVVVGLIGHAESYDGKIDVSVASDHVYYYQGDTVTADGFVFRAEPIPDEIVQIKILDPEGVVVHTGETLVDSEMSLFEETAEVWKFQYTFEIDEKYEPRIRYVVEVIYDDKSDTSGFSFSPLPEQQVIESGQALEEGKLVFNDDEHEPASTEETLPDWVKNIFLWYGQDQISEKELLGAIEYLIEIGMIQVSN